MSDNTRSDQIWVLAGTAAKLSYGILVLKLVATRYGVEPLGLTGQLLSILALVLLVSNLGASRGIVQVHSESTTTEERSRYNAAAVAISVTTSAMVVVVGLLLVGPVKSGLLSGAPLPAVALVFAVAPLMALNTLTTSVAVAHGFAKRSAQAAVASNASGIVILAGIGSGGIDRVLIVLGCQSVLNTLWVQGLLARLLARRQLFSLPTAVIQLRRAGLPRREARSLLRYAAAITIPVGMLLVGRIVSRLILAHNFGPIGVGQWESVMALSDGSTQLFGALLAFLFLPKIARHPGLTSRLRLRYTTLGVCAGVLGTIIALVAGPQVLELLYSSALRSQSSNLVLILLRDTVLILYFVNQTILLSRRAFTPFLALEAVRSTLLVGAALTGYLDPTPELSCVFFAYVATAVLLTLASVALTRRSVVMSASESEMPQVPETATRKTTAQ